MASVGWKESVQEAGGCVAVQTVSSPSLSGLMHADHSLLAHTLAWLVPVPPVGWIQKQLDICIAYILMLTYQDDYIPGSKYTHSTVLLISRS